MKSLSTLLRPLETKQIGGFKDAYTGARAHILSMSPRRKSKISEEKLLFPQADYEDGRIPGILPAVFRPFFLLFVQHTNYVANMDNGWYSAMIYPYSSESSKSSSFAQLANTIGKSSIPVCAETNQYDPST